MISSALFDDYCIAIDFLRCFYKEKCSIVEAMKVLSSFTYSSSHVSAIEVLQIISKVFEDLSAKA